MKYERETLTDEGQRRLEARERELADLSKKAAQAKEPLDAADDTLREAILRLPMPPVAAINAVANAFRGSTTYLHALDGRVVKVGPLDDDSVDDDAPPLSQQPNAPPVTPPRVATLPIGGDK